MNNTLYGLFFFLLLIIPRALPAQPADWLLNPTPYRAKVTEQGGDVVLSNGLVSRTFRIKPFLGCYSFKRLDGVGQEWLRAIRPEAEVNINGQSYNVGGAEGQFEHGYMKTEWLSRFQPAASGWVFSHYSIADTIRPLLTWQPKRWYSSQMPWPPRGIALTLHFKGANEALSGLMLNVHYELYDGLPVVCKWMSLTNSSTRNTRLQFFKSEILAVVEYESAVGGDGRLRTPPMLVSSNYAFGDMTSRYSNQTSFWKYDTLYTSQVNYNLKTNCLLECHPPVGPDILLAPGQTFESFRTWELLHDGDERERQGLAERRMYQTLMPWTSENPIFMHLVSTEPEQVRRIIDQCAEVGFEMVILSFGSGLSMEDTSAANIQKFKALADYAHAKGIELGGYSLFSSRHIGPNEDVINPATGKPGGAIFGYAPCMAGQWGLDYLAKVKYFIETTGFDLLEHDGPYPGDVCASQNHAGHRGLADSQWQQWALSDQFYRQLRTRGVYVNAPDWYFWNGSSKVALGYREVNWSLPRDRQIVLGRQNLYDGTWTKTPSMGWTFVPLSQYHGGGEAATLEPLAEHLHEYEAHLAQNFGTGVQACYRGPRLYDTDDTQALLKRLVNWYKRYRAILNSDVVHLRRPDGRDWDGIMHVNAQLSERAFVMLYNPLPEPITRRIQLPLYYTGLTKKALVSQEGAKARMYKLDRSYSVSIEVSIPANGYTWLVIE